jgi:hypothetical protein
LWHSRNHNPLYGAGLALLATIFLAPVVQAWYLVWPLAMFAATKVRIRWFIIAVTFLSCGVLPDGSGFTKILRAPMSFVVTGIVIWAFVRGLTWLRGFDPKEIEFSEEAINGFDHPPAVDDEFRAGFASTAPAIAGARSSNGRSAAPPDGG